MSIPTIPIEVDFTVAEDIQRFDMTVAEQNVSVDMSVATPIVTSTVDPYDGPTEATPSGEEQVFQTADKRMLENFVVHPIPSNYGLITYNGTYITVS